MVNLFRSLWLFAGVLLLPCCPLQADEEQDTPQGTEEVNAEEALSAWVKREIKRTRKLVQIVGRIKDRASCDRAIESIRALYWDARKEELLDPCPGDDFSFEQLTGKQKRQFNQHIKLLRKELLSLYENHVASSSENMYSREPSMPRKRARSNTDSKISLNKFEELGLAFSDFVFVHDEIFPLDE